MSNSNRANATSQMAALLLNRTSGYSLEQPFYCDPDLFELDTQQLFYREWLFVGHDCEIPEAGDWFRYDIEQTSVILIRGAQGQINAFHNSCRHRGAQICLSERGQGNNLVCPYHQWTYDTEGNLVFAKDMGPDFNPKQHGLATVHCRTVEGMIFICLADEAPEFEEFAARLRPYLAPHQLHNTKVAFQSSIVEKGNWKLVFENNRECYHCGGSHPELCRTFPEDPGVTGIEISGPSAEMAAHWEKCEAQNLPSKFYLSESGQYRMVRVPLVEDSESYTMNRKVACKIPLVETDDKALGALLFFHYPNSWNHFLSDHVVTFCVTPISPQETRVTTKWLVHKDAVEGQDYDLKDLIEVWQATNDQDRQLVEMNQAGINSPAYRPGPYSEIQENGVMQFVDWYCDFSTKALTRAEAFAPEPESKAPAELRQNQIPALDIPVVETRSVPVTEPEVPTPPLTEQANTRTMAEQVSLVAAIERQSPYVYLEKSQPWIDQGQLLELVTIVPETQDVATFSFQPEGGGYFSFAPGQFITLELPVNGETLYRTYTISSSPSRPLSLSLTVKAQPESVGSRWMIDNLKPGMKLRAHGPAGQFHLYNYAADKYCFISAGSGITPMMAMTRFLYDRGDQPDISFINAARKPSEIIFRSALEQMASRVPGIKLSWIVEERDDFAAWGGYIGRFNQLMLELTTPDFFERSIFCCGPEPFMQAVRDILIAANFDMSRYHEESFVAPVLGGDIDQGYDDRVLDDSAPALVRFAISGEEVHSTQGITLLDSAKELGLNIPSACNFGVCGTCKVKVISGETHMVHNGGISDRDIEEGYVLACCTRPVEDVTLAF